MRALLARIRIDMVGRARRTRARLRPAQKTWRAGLADEIEFWSQWFTTKGLQWPDEYERRMDSAAMLQPELDALLTPGQRARVLDVGAGPLTTVGKRRRDGELELTATDSLAATYDELLAQANVIPLVRTIACDAERLLERFGSETFDLAHARNTLDHAYDPMTAIEQMVAVVRPGGHVVLRHNENEAETENYAGLHQWNFSESDGRLVLWRPGEHLDVEQRLSGRAERVASLPDSEGLLITVFRKTDVRVG